MDFFFIIMEIKKIIRLNFKKNINQIIAIFL
mgnify:CR=1 FL=1|jgi:hypothetical protein